MNHFPLFTQPEMVRMPLDSIVLRIKSMGIHDMSSFPFPTPPPAHAVARAEDLLRVLGMLDHQGEGKVTQLGKLAATVPASPRLGLVLVLGKMWKCLAHATALVAVLSVGDPFIRTSPKQKSKKKKGAEDTKLTKAQVP